MLENPGTRSLSQTDFRDSLAIPARPGHRNRPRPEPWLLAWCERAGAVLLLLLLLPLLVLAACAIAALSRRSPLIAHARVGRYGRRIWALKLRTMWSPDPAAQRGTGFIEHIEGDPVPEDKRQPDTRVTSRLAAFCRRHSIDELPQLWHVITGEMSLVGPRPLTQDEIRRWYGSDAAEVLRSKPGLSGLWQVSGRSSLSYEQRREMDLFLVRNWSLRLYFGILLATIPGVISGRNAG